MKRHAILIWLGVDASGYEDNGVENLRYRLSSFLCQNSSRKLSQLSQIAIVNALLGLLSLSITELIESTIEVPAVVSPPNDNPTDCIWEWYSGLSNELLSLSFSLLQSASVSCCTTSWLTAALLIWPGLSLNWNFVVALLTARVRK
ncbi:hypothetical protein RHMOL_Rhmol13G0158800 [Rhododendron molle]|uniref:Uncharacterized protein n=1 Tax=Rhododendron molle TaxID=49168 RepID=A0ACC0L7Q7_RHOML|nr:hypothetical protein RHMOL_Rhmol13G0158800 [Rhododendron molle]